MPDQGQEIPQGPWTIYVCPEHGGPLDEMYCQACGWSAHEKDGIEVIPAHLQPEGLRLSDDEIAYMLGEAVLDSDEVEAMDVKLRAELERRRDPTCDHGEGG